MPIAVEAGGVGVACVASCELPVVAGVRLEVAESSSSSSIGENSDGSGAVGSGSDGEEVESGCGGALEALDALEESLPIRRSISKFYHGKSKSFTTLLDAASCSTKDFIKPENAYTRKRKNLLAYHITWNTSNTTSKRPAIATSMNKMINTTSYCNGEQALLKPANIASMVGSSGLKKCCLSMRSYSMMNLQGTSNSRSAIRPSNNEKM
ncbi:hypothetical protein IHE45_05G201200 [Dioscorea alata]|uniref:Uncharacterized protein n=1 Tax=Dioscorea alata TaxID=55571 RepID=A0ACB7W8E9_DIOAL|nr:hypothetical protein IHE45_05G201200 [Dioscorea alata]